MQKIFACSVSPAATEELENGCVVVVNQVVHKLCFQIISSTLLDLNLDQTQGSSDLGRRHKKRVQSRLNVHKYLTREEIRHKSV